MKAKFLILSLALVSILSFAVAPQAHAVNLFGNCSTLNNGQCGIVAQNDLDYNSKNNRVWNITKVAMGLLGAISVIMIVIAGIKYTTSQGDQSAVASAKNTILYAVIGIIVAISATAIVAFITNQFG